jgi:hypothetical protein
MPKIVWDKCDACLLKRLNDRGFLNISYCREEVQGMKKITPRSFHHHMNRMERRHGLYFMKKQIQIPSPAGKRSQTVYYIEGCDIESLIKASIGLDWLTEKEKCMNHMAEHYRRNYLGTMKRVSELAEECRIQNYKLLMMLSDINSEKPEWMRVTRLHYVGNGQQLSLWGER